jgi:hypothetical protein
MGQFEDANLEIGFGVVFSTNTACFSFDFVGFRQRNHESEILYKCTKITGGCLEVQLMAIEYISDLIILLVSTLYHLTRSQAILM